MRHDVRSVLPVQATLGEGPVWIGRDAALWFVDIKQRHVHRFDPATGTAHRWDAPEQVGWVLPAADGGMIAGLQSGLYRFDPADGTFRPHAAPDGHPTHNRLNDAATDSHVRNWFGTMDDGEKGRAADGEEAQDEIRGRGHTFGCHHCDSTIHSEVFRAQPDRTRGQGRCSRYGAARIGKDQYLQDQHLR